MLFVSKEYVSNQKIAKFVAGVRLIEVILYWNWPFGNWKVSVLQSARLTARPSYRGFFCIKGIGILPGNCQVSVLERCPSYGMSVLWRFHCITNPWPKKRRYHKPVTEEKVSTFKALFYFSASINICKEAECRIYDTSNTVFIALLPQLSMVSKTQMPSGCFSQKEITLHYWKHVKASVKSCVLKEITLHY